MKGLSPFGVILTIISNYMLTFIYSRNVASLRSNSNWTPIKKVNNELFSKRIYNGSLVEDIRYYPYMASIVSEEIIYQNSTYKKSGLYLCGCTILSPKFVLTAAHCVKSCNCGREIDDDSCYSCKETDPNIMHVFAGSTYMIESEETSKIKTINIHPEYKFVDGVNKCRNRFDIAVLELETELPFSDTISNVQLPDAVDLGKEVPRSLMVQNCLVLGWGDFDSNDLKHIDHNRLRVGETIVISIAECDDLMTIKSRSLFDIFDHFPKRFHRPPRIPKRDPKREPKRMPNIIYKRMSRSVCTDTGLCSKMAKIKTSICRGDSGGPIMCNGVQVGVSSMGPIGCGIDPSMFNRVDVSVNWIKKIVSQD